MSFDGKALFVRCPDGSVKVCDVVDDHPMGDQVLEELKATVESFVMDHEFFIEKVRIEDWDNHFLTTPSVYGVFDGDALLLTYSLNRQGELECFKDDPDISVRRLAIIR